MPSYRIRPFSYLGTYPKGDISIGDDLFFRSGKMLFSCTKNKIVEISGRSEAHQPAFELDNWTLEEVRLYSSLYIGNGESSSIRLYPLPVNQDMFLPDPFLIIKDEALLETLLGNISSDDYLMSGNRGLAADRFEQFNVWDWGERRVELANIFWNALDLGDAPVVRGLHALLKSEMLFNHFQFLDASLAASHIALDAAYNVVLRRLKKDGRSNATSKDAQAYVDDLWGIPKSGLNFFEDYYVDRIRNFHTDSRYGAEAIPFFCFDDILDLNAALKGLFFLLVTGKMHDETKRYRDDSYGI